MKTFAVTFLFFVSMACIAAEPDTWFRDWPRGSTGQDIPSELVVEIPHSLFEHAETLLKDEPFLRVGNDYLPGFSYKCPIGTTAYLIRALYEHPTNGMFNVKKSGDTLLVRHYALGHKSDLHRSALIVCLAFVPKQVYVATGGAL
jgi:hypothetical protein